MRIHYIGKDNLDSYFFFSFLKPGIFCNGHSIVRIWLGMSKCTVHTFLPACGRRDTHALIVLPPLLAPYIRQQMYCIASFNNVTVFTGFWQ